MQSEPKFRRYSLNTLNIHRCRPCCQISHLMLWLLSHDASLLFNGLFNVSRCVGCRVVFRVWFRDTRVHKYLAVCDWGGTSGSDDACQRTKVLLAYILEETKKVTNSDISCMRPDASCSPIAPIFGSWGRVLDVVTHTKFHGDRFRGFAPRGSRKSHFSHT